MNKFHKPALNLDKLWALVSEQTRQYYKDKTDGPAPVIDVVRAVSMPKNFIIRARNQGKKPLCYTNTVNFCHLVKFVHQYWVMI